MLTDTKLILVSEPLKGSAQQFSEFCANKSAIAEHRPLL